MFDANVRFENYIALEICKSLKYIRCYRITYRIDPIMVNSI